MLKQTAHPGYSTPETDATKPLDSFDDVLKTIDAKTAFTVTSTRKKQLLKEKYSDPDVFPTQKPNEYIRAVCGDLEFAEDVVEERCYHMTKYDDKYFKRAVDTKDFLRRPVVTPPIPGGRHNQRGEDLRHVNCHFEHRQEYRLQPLKRHIRKMAKEMQEIEKKELTRRAEEQKKLEELEEMKYNPDEDQRLQARMELRNLKQYNPHLYKSLKARRRADKALKEAQEAARATAPVEFPLPSSRLPGSKKAKKERPTVLLPNLWAEATLSRVTENTANWIAAHHTAPYFKNKIQTFLTQRYGQVSTKPDLIQISDDSGDEDANADKDEKPKEPWKKPDETLLDRIRVVMKEKGMKDTEPYNDDTSAAFYRMPAGFKKARKEQMKEEDAICNSTAYNIAVPPTTKKPLPTLRDVLNPAVGDKILQTDNPYQQQMLTSGEYPLFTHDKKDVITLGSNKFKKQLQPIQPLSVEQWCPTKKEKFNNDQDMDQDLQQLVKRGFHRWEGLPEQVHSDQATDPSASASSTKPIDAYDTSHEKGFDAMANIAFEWRRRWYMDIRYADATPDDLIRDMADYHPHIRLRAITTCARAAEYRPPPQLGVQIGEGTAAYEHIRLLPENLFIALECCLEDTHPRVQLAAAIALYTLERPMGGAEKVLRRSLEQGSVVDCWAACQCLAFYGECDSVVVETLLTKYLQREDLLQREQAASLLVSLSHGSTLVHSMLAECLNSNHWRHRLTSILIIPRLTQPISRDLCHKLHYLMWNDWHSQVRQAAAQTLGRTGHGREVHDHLTKRLAHRDERIRTDALEKVGYLGIMTLKLLPSFLICFTDIYQSVREAACRTCCYLNIKDDSIVEKLIQVINYDRVWKVKRQAIVALTHLKAVTPRITDAVLWAFRYEDHPSVRKEACKALMHMTEPGPRLVEMLQTQYLVEHAPEVRSEISKALLKCGVSASEDMEMLAQIKREVQQLCQKEHVVDRIMEEEALVQKHENFKRLLYMEELEKDIAASHQKSRTPRPFSPRPQSQRNKSRGTSAKSSVPPSIPEENNEEMSAEEESDREIKELYDTIKESKRQDSARNSASTVSTGHSRTSRDTSPQSKRTSATEANVKGKKHGSIQAPVARSESTTPENAPHDSNPTEVYQDHEATATPPEMTDGTENKPKRDDSDQTQALVKPEESSIPQEEKEDKTTAGQPKRTRYKGKGKRGGSAKTQAKKGESTKTEEAKEEDNLTEETQDKNTTREEKNVQKSKALKKNEKKSPRSNQSSKKSRKGSPLPEIILTEA